MHNKKGFELSLNFLIVMILSIFILVGGIVFTYRFLNVVQDREDSIDEQTKRQIEDLLIEGHQVAIPIDTIKIRKGDQDMFGIGIYNTLRDGTSSFRVALKFKQAYDKSNNLMTSPEPDEFIDSNWVFGDRDSEYEIGPNKHEVVSVPVTVNGKMSNSGDTTRAGLYEFDVCVCPCREEDGCGSLQVNSNDFCISSCEPNNENLYGKHIMKLYVEVPE